MKWNWTTLLAFFESKVFFLYFFFFWVELIGKFSVLNALFSDTSIRRATRPTSKLTIQTWRNIPSRNGFVLYSCQQSSGHHPLLSNKPSKIIHQWVDKSINQFIQSVILVNQFSNPKISINWITNSINIKFIFHYFSFLLIIINK